MPGISTSSMTSAGGTDDASACISSALLAYDSVSYPRLRRNVDK